jgi:hypothetical protein
MSLAASGRVGQYYGELMTHPETLNRQFKLLWLGVEGRHAHPTWRSRIRCRADKCRLFK